MPYSGKLLDIIVLEQCEVSYLLYLCLYLLPCCCMNFAIPFEIQRDKVLKKLNFYVLTPRVLGERGLGVGNICYDVAAFVIPFNLICNVTMF